MFGFTHATSKCHVPPPCLFSWLDASSAIHLAPKPLINRPPSAGVAFLFFTQNVPPGNQQPVLWRSNCSLLCLSLLSVFLLLPVLPSGPTLSFRTTPRPSVFNLDLVSVSVFPPLIRYVLPPLLSCALICCFVPSIALPTVGFLCKRSYQLLRLVLCVVYVCHGDPGMWNFLPPLPRVVEQRTDEKWNGLLPSEGVKIGLKQVHWKPCLWRCICDTRWTVRKKQKENILCKQYRD